jgi:hypothetical protein
MGQLIEPFVCVKACSVPCWVWKTLVLDLMTPAWSSTWRPGGGADGVQFRSRRQWSAKEKTNITARGAVRSVRGGDGILSSRCEVDAVE